MFKYLLYFVLVGPLIGVILMEYGAYSWSASTFGYKNGASFAFLGYIALVLLAFFFTIKTNLFPFSLKYRTPNWHFKNLSIIIFTINLLFLIMFLFGFGGIDVLLLKIGKGELRAGMGFLGTLGLGSIGQMIIKGFAPALLAYLSFIYIKIRKTPKNKFLLLINFIIVFLIGAITGYKAAAIFILLPALILIYWRIPFKKVLAFGLLFLVLLIAFAMVYDRQRIDFKNLGLSQFMAPPQNAITAVVYRLTVLQGDVSWKIWDMYINKEELFPYIPTLLSAGGNRLLFAYGSVSREQYFKEFAKYHYSTMLTYVVGDYPLEALRPGYTNFTGTVFSEGIIAGGLLGLFIFSTIAGLLAGINYKIIKYSLKNNNAVLAALASTYFVSGVFSWLYSGGIVTLFHIAIIIQFILIFILIELVVLLSKGFKNFKEPA